MESVETHTEARKPQSLFKLLAGDKVIGGIYLVLIAISALEMFSASAILVYRFGAVPSAYAYEHMQFLIGGLILLVFAQRMSFTAIKQWGVLIYAFGALGMLVTIGMGESHQGAARSLLGFIQPVEFCKLGAIMLIAQLITTKNASYTKWPIFKKRTELKRYLFMLLMAAVVILPVASQNMSSGIIIGLSVCALFFLGNVRLKYMGWTALTLAVVGGIFLFYLHTVYLNNVDSGKTGDQVAGLGRIPTWANRIYDKPEGEIWDYDIDGKYSQVVLSHMAVANSYPLGKFLGNSTVRDYLPEAYSDYIFAIIFEEWAFWGAGLLVILYLSLLLRVYWISTQTDDLLKKLLLLGLSLQITIQALIHMGVCTGAMFVTGQPLPLISRGGSSIVCTSFNIGILLALAKIIQQEKALQEQNVIQQEN